MRPPNDSLSSKTGAAGMSRAHLKPITSVRFFAALLVVVFHAFNSFSAAAILQGPAPVIHFINAGFVGVSVFFILSGFILAYTYLETDLGKPAQRREFYLSRLARIYPVYLLGLVVAAPKFFYSLLDLGAAGMAKAIFLTGLPVVTLTQSWIPSLATAWNPPGWSLSAEAFFYLVFPWAALWVKGWPGVRRPVVTMVIFWLLGLLAPTLYYILIPGTAGWGNFLKFNPLLRLPEFLVGLCLGRIFLHGGTHRLLPHASKWLALTTVLAVVVMSCSQLLPKYVLYNGLLDPIFVLFIYALASLSIQGGRVARLFSSPWLLLLGEASYALYILHVPLQRLVVGAIGKTMPSVLQQPWTATVLLLGYLVFAVGVSILTFKMLEVPARRWIKSRFRPKHQAQPGLGSQTFSGTTAEAAVVASGSETFVSAQALRFTVVIPVYNDVTRVGRAVQSVLDQTMGDFELLVIDDCSTDNTAEVVATFRDPRLRFIRNERNLGCGGNKNKGLTLAAAPFFKALDSDDWLEPTYLEKTLAVFQAEPTVALVTTAATEHFEAQGAVTKLRPNPGPSGVYGRHDGLAFQEHYFRGASAGNPTQVAVRTAWARAAGGWDARLVNGDETALWLRIVRGRQAVFLSEPLVHITLHPASLTVQASRTGLEVLHIAKMFQDALADLPELNTTANRFWLVWTRGYVWFSRGRKLFCRLQLRDAFGCWRQIAIFAPTLWWVPIFVARMMSRRFRQIIGGEAAAPSMAHAAHTPGL